MRKTSHFAHDQKDGDLRVMRYNAIDAHMINAELPYVRA
jgi:hypothetical protein